MIGDAVLGEIVGANAFVAFAGADLCFSLGGIFGVFLRHLLFEQARAQHGQGARFVLLLRPLVGAADDQAGGFVNDLHGGIGRVHALAAGTGSAAAADLQILVLDFDVDLFRFGQHGDGAGAGVDAPLRLGRRHTLNAMHAALVFEAFVDIRPGDLKDHLFITAQV
jgi:hypothetical protein